MRLWHILGVVGSVMFIYGGVAYTDKAVSEGGAAFLIFGGAIMFTTGMILSYKK